MSDLISRRDLLKKLESMTNDNSEYIRNNSHQFTYKELAYIICNQPTAYDIEKIVAELEEEKEISCADFTKYVNEYSPCLDDEYDDFFHKGLERAIVIIGKGGAE